MITNGDFIPPDRNGNCPYKKSAFGDTSEAIKVEEDDDDEAEQLMSYSYNYDPLVSRRNNSSFYYYTVPDTLTLDNMWSTTKAIAGADEILTSIQNEEFAARDLKEAPFNRLVDALYDTRAAYDNPNYDWDYYQFSQMDPGLTPEPFHEWVGMVSQNPNINGRQNQAFGDASATTTAEERIIMEEAKDLFAPKLIYFDEDIEAQV
jgi:hypothetical protein